MSKKIGAMTITFGDVCENHVRMQKLGALAPRGFSIQDLEQAQRKFETAGWKCELVDLNELLTTSGSQAPGPEGAPAAVLVIREGVPALVSDIDTGNNDAVDALEAQLLALDWDKKAFMYGRVVNKHARWNLCFASADQEPQYELGLGRVVSFDNVPLLNNIKTGLEDILGEVGQGLCAEGNLYFDLSQCGIGYHGDGERRKVIASRLGATMPICYQWFQNSKPIGRKATIMLNHGDMYIMSEKAVGTDWKLKKTPTLRHAAGAAKFTTVPDA